MCPPRNNKNSDIERWLQKIGLEDYIPVFASEEIDHEVLVELTDADLKEIGIPLGPRKKLLKAIAELHLRQPPTAELTQESATSSSESSDAQRRQLTVMFCDLVGSTELSTQIDPEELSDLYRTYRHLCEQVVSEHNGYVAEFLGDGIVAYFGYPQAQVDQDRHRYRPRCRRGPAWHERQRTDSLGDWRNAESGCPAAGDRRAGSSRDF